MPVWEMRMRCSGGDGGGDRLPGLVADWGRFWNEVCVLAEERTRIQAGGYAAYGRLIDETDRHLPEGEKLWRLDQEIQRLEVELERLAVSIVKSRALDASRIASKLDMALLLISLEDHESEQVAKLIESARRDLAGLAEAA